MLLCQSTSVSGSPTTYHTTEVFIGAFPERPKAGCGEGRDVAKQKRLGFYDNLVGVLWRLEKQEKVQRQ